MAIPSDEEELRFARALESRGYTVTKKEGNSCKEAVEGSPKVGRAALITSTDKKFQPYLGWLAAIIGRSQDGSHWLLKLLWKHPLGELVELPVGSFLVHDAIDQMYMKLLELPTHRPAGTRAELENLYPDSLFPAAPAASSSSSSSRAPVAAHPPAGAVGSLAPSRGTTRARSGSASDLHEEHGLFDSPKRSRSSGDQAVVPRPRISGTGPWTDEEVASLRFGQHRYGNTWEQIRKKCNLMRFTGTQLRLKWRLLQEQGLD